MNENLPTVSVEKAGEIMESVIAKGDLAQLTPNDRARYYRTVCDSIGLNPLTKPFEYITLNGKLTLYARKDATDQLRKRYGVSVIDMTETREEGLVIVTVKVRDAGGRTDMAKGAVTLKGLQGEALANAFMKCETKAKRRATLSICGLGFLDETEIETISQAKTNRLAKKDARDIYKRLQAEIDSIRNRAEFDRWCAENDERIKVLPEDWEDTLLLRIQEHKVDIARAEPPVIDEPPAELWTDGDTPPEWDSKWDALGPVKQAGVLCHDGAFWKFLSKMFPESYVDNESAAAVVVRNHCGVGSRSALGTSKDAAKLWRVLVEEYRTWQREPSVIDAAPPEPEEKTVPEYIADWNLKIQNATDELDADAMVEEWNGEAEQRKTMQWPAGSFIALQKKVKAAIAHLKKPAEEGAK